MYFLQIPVCCFLLYSNILLSLSFWKCVFSWCEKPSSTLVFPWSLIILHVDFVASEPLRFLPPLTKPTTTFEAQSGLHTRSLKGDCSLFLVGSGATLQGHSKPPHRGTDGNSERRRKADRDNLEAHLGLKACLFGRTQKSLCREN